MRLRQTSLYDYKLYSTDDNSLRKCFKSCLLHAIIKRKLLMSTFGDTTHGVGMRFQIFSRTTKMLAGTKPNM